MFFLTMFLLILIGIVLLAVFVFASISRERMAEHRSVIDHVIAPRED